MRSTAAVVGLLLFAFILPSNCSLGSEGEALEGLLEPYLEKYELPALAAAVVKQGEVVAVGAVGTRKLGAKIPVTRNDRFHLGSNTKAMTALLAAKFVDEGKLKWNSTVGEVFPELSEKMNADFKQITLEQLLSHTGGIPNDSEDCKEMEALFENAMRQQGNLDEMRYWMVKSWSTKAPKTKPGTAFVYSNLGYIIVGAMVERVSSRTWEELATDHLFLPLGLSTAGFGPQATLGRIDAPLAHAPLDGKLRSFLAGPNGDNPPILGPAGTVHMSVLDFARWAGWNAGQGRRGPKLISEASLVRLHTPVITLPKMKNHAPGTPSSGKYALGWGEVTVSWAPEPLIYHAGSNAMNLALVFLNPKQDFAMVIVTNIGGTKANDGLFKLAAMLYEKYAEIKK